MGSAGCLSFNSEDDVRLTNITTTVENALVKVTTKLVTPRDSAQEAIVEAKVEQEGETVAKSWTTDDIIPESESTVEFHFTDVDGDVVGENDITFEDYTAYARVKTGSWEKATEKDQ